MTFAAGRIVTAAVMNAHTWTPAVISTAGTITGPQAAGTYGVHAAVSITSAALGWGAGQRLVADVDVSCLVNPAAGQTVDLLPIGSANAFGTVRFARCYGNDTLRSRATLDSGTGDTISFQPLATVVGAGNATFFVDARATWSIVRVWPKNT